MLTQRAGKANKTQASFSGGKGFAYQFEGTGEGQPVVEQGWIVTAGKNVYWVRAQFAGKDALNAGEDGLDGIFLEARTIGLEIIHNARLTDEEAAVDPSLACLRLLGESRHCVVVENDAAEAGGGTHCCYGHELAVGPVEAEQGTEVNVGDSVAVGDHKRLALEPGL